MSNNLSMPTTESVPRVRPLTIRKDWSLSEYICTAGPADRAFEERHENFTIATVIQGTFSYRADSGRSTLYPGAVLLGNAGSCFECGHDHSHGDRCVALHLTSDYLAEIAASTSGSSSFAFPTPMLPVTPKALPWLAQLETGACQFARLQSDEIVPKVVEAVIEAVSGTEPRRGTASARDERRISNVLHYLELASQASIELDDLAAMACMSKYHFLRTFSRVVGLTPYQYLLSIRMRGAAVRLSTTSEPVSAIAFEAGFGDLSTFNSRFRSIFGMTPTEYRRHN
jgi:AraC-like DNA-binding protein